MKVTYTKKPKQVSLKFIIYSKFQSTDLQEKFWLSGFISMGLYLMKKNGLATQQAANLLEIKEIIKSRIATGNIKIMWTL